MSEEPFRKSAPRKDVDKREQSNSVKASGDATLRKKPSRSKSKCRIPKSLRFDLENALVGLCDVWFEQIKPYLVQNNVKIHLHNDTGDGSGDRGVVTGNCSHLDPGRSHRHQHTNVSYADYCSTRPTVLKAQRRKQPLPLPPVVAAATQTPFKWKKEKTRKRTKCHQSEPRQPIPRLCHSYNLPLLFSKENNLSTKENVTENYYFQNIQKLTIRKPKLKRANTQTDTVHCGEHKAPQKMRNTNCTTSKLSPSPDLAHKKNQHDKDYPLVSDDIIDFIAKKHDKKLQVLFVSPRKEFSSSVMNLYVPPNSKNAFCKTPPWR